MDSLYGIPDSTLHRQDSQPRNDSAVNVLGVKVKMSTATLLNAMLAARGLSIRKGEQWGKDSKNYLYSGTMCQS